MLTLQNIFINLKRKCIDFVHGHNKFCSYEETELQAIDDVKKAAMRVLNTPYDFFDEENSSDEVWAAYSNMKSAMYDKTFI